MNKQCIEDISIACTNNAFKLNNATVIVGFEPISELMIAGLFMIIAGIADVYNNIFFLIKKCFNDSSNSYCNTFIKTNDFVFRFIF